MIYLTTIITCVLLNFLKFTNCQNEYIPVMIWTSRDLQERNNVEYSMTSKIQRKQFENYLTEILRKKNPIIIIFLEETLSAGDFDWRDENGRNSFPFLTNLSYHSRVDYFRAVKAPFRALTESIKKDYEWENLEPTVNFKDKNSVFLLLEFEKINGHRPEMLINHDETMKTIYYQLEESEKDWVCIYTAKMINSNEYLSEFKSMSPWHVEQRVLEIPSKIISLYQDDRTEFTLMTKGPIQLLLPSPRNMARKVLEEYTKASAKRLKDKMDFIIWFPNYTLTFYLHQSNGKWTIDSMKIENLENRDVLNLSQRLEESYPDRKCGVAATEFQSQGKPIVKVKLSKYKVLRIPSTKESCDKPFSFHLLIYSIFFSLVSIVSFWNGLLKNRDFRSKSKLINVLPDKIFHCYLE